MLGAALSYSLVCVAVVVYVPCPTSYSCPLMCQAINSKQLPPDKLPTPRYTSQPIRLGISTA